MSGPKFSCYTLSEFKRALLLEEQRFQMETICQQRILSDIDRLIKAFEEQVQRIDELVQASSQIPMEAERIQKSLVMAKTKVKDLLKHAPAASAELKELNVELRSIRDEISKNLSSADAFYNGFRLAVRDELSQTVQTGFSLSFAGIVSKRKRGNRYLKRINELLEEIGPDIPQPMRERYLSICRQADEIVNVDYLENFCSVVVEPFVRDCRMFADYDEVAERYRMLSQEAGVDIQQFACTSDGIREMKAASEHLELQVLAERERVYINSALDAAMQEMGYQMVGSRTQQKKDGRRIRHGLYSLHNGTAVDVTFADNGQISMELGGIGGMDRSPTVEESVQLVDDMQSFCRDYAVLEKKLAERGVRMTCISHMPPSAEYAQIINANDYELSSPLEHFTVEGNVRKDAVIMHRE